MSFPIEKSSGATEVKIHAQESENPRLLCEL